jgi:hypothetical protein
MEKAPKRRRPISPNKPKGNMKTFVPYQEQQKNNITGPTWPRFVCLKGIVGAEASPFVINRAITGLIGTPEKIKKLRDGSLLIQAKSEYQSSVLLNTNTIAGTINVTCQKHATLNTKKGLLHCPEISNLAEETICEELADQGVVEVRRIVRRSPPSQTPSPPAKQTHLYCISFATHTLPKEIKVGYLIR